MIECWSSKRKRRYWFDPVTGKSQWERPKQQQPSQPRCIQCMVNDARMPGFPDCADCNPHNRRLVSYANVNGIDDD